MLNKIRRVEKCNNCNHLQYSAFHASKKISKSKEEELI